MILQELLDTKISDFSVMTDNDHEYDVEAKIGDRIISFGASKSGEKWSVAFLEKKNFALNFQTFDITGSGKEFEVFSFVKQCIERLIAKHHPEVIKFSADKSNKSRAGVYEKLLKRFLKGYTFAKKEIKIHGSPATEFTLEKI